MRRSTVLLIVLVCAGVTAGQAAAAAPANDGFADAVVISGGNGTSIGTTVEATSEPGEPSSYGGGHSVWYRWTAPAAGSVTFDTCTATFDTVLFVYTGASVDALTAVASNDDGCAPGSRVSFNAAAGVEYRIDVDTYRARDPGNFTLAWGPTPAPVSVRAPSISGVRRIGQTLTLTPGQWSSAASSVIVHQWQRCGNGCVDVPGATGTVYLLGPADVGFDLAVTETAISAAGSTTLTAWAGLVDGYTPIAVDAPSYDGSPRAGQTGTAQPGTWSTGSPTTHAFQWQRCSHSGGVSGLTNVALLAPARASGVSADHPAAMAVDGNLESSWAAGVGPRQSIEIDLGVPTPVAALRLHASQSPAGITVHRITGRASFESDEITLREIGGTTADRDTLEAPIAEETVRFIRIETVVSPAPVAWREIEVLSRCRDIPGAATESYKPSTRDIGFSLRFIVHATNADGTTSAVTSETDPVKGCIVPRLAGKTVGAARAALNKAGCKLGRVDRAQSRLRAGLILRQSAAWKARRVWRAPIGVVISSGP